MSVEPTQVQLFILNDEDQNKSIIQAFCVSVCWELYVERFV